MKRSFKLLLLSICVIIIGTSFVGCNKNYSEEISFFNYGENIDEDFLAGIFTPFRKGIKGEFGLGLSIVKKTLNMIGYDIVIKNDKKGVSFIITKGVH